MKVFRMVKVHAKILLDDFDGMCALFLYFLPCRCQEKWTWFRGRGIKRQAITDTLTLAISHSGIPTHLELFFMVMVLSRLTEWWKNLHQHQLCCTVAGTSLKLEIRLLAYPVGTNTRSATFLCSSDWLKHSELGYFARSPISGLKVPRNPNACWLLLIRSDVYTTYRLTLGYKCVSYIL